MKALRMQKGKERHLSDPFDGAEDGSDGGAEEEMADAFASVTHPPARGGLKVMRAADGFKQDKRGSDEQNANGEFRGFRDLSDALPRHAISFPDNTHTLSAVSAPDERSFWERAATARGDSAEPSF